MTPFSYRSVGERRRRALAGLVGIVLVALVPSAAAEPERSSDRTACADAYRNGQTRRRSGALRRAHESLLVCVSDRCPAVLHPDCLRWLTEVEAAMPSVTFAAKGEDGADITDVVVSLDGQAITDTLDGKSIAIDPGSHTVRFERAGEAPIEQALVVREGEKSRVVSVSWAKVSNPRPSDRSGTASAGPPPSTWIFGGLGAASLATFGVLAIHGMERRSALQQECFGSCDQSRIDAIKSELAIADVALGIGVVSIGIATVLFLTSGSTHRSTNAASTEASKGSAERAVSVGLAAQKSGGAVGLSGSF
ncbi:MAG: hypothetical protein JWO86_660 [Myxococcaceae bacterium]|nr:hypothetical protein [Myxococcaceae bacterium]